MKSLLIIGLILGTFLSVFGQISPTQTNPGEGNAQNQDSRERDRQANERLNKVYQRNSDRQNIETAARTFDPPIIMRGDKPREVIDPNRKTTKKELAVIMPEQADLDKFAEFLRQPKTGLTRLIADMGCNENSNVIVVTADCLKYTMPGGGSSYSFRVRDYRTNGFADLNLADNKFKSSEGRDIQGILTILGDIPLEKVDSQTMGLNFLYSFKPETEREKISKSKDQFTNGVLRDNFIYRSQWGVIENTTYVLRSIAYKNRHYFDRDKKNDIIIAFRIVRKSSDNSITILWKELVSKGSPTIKEW